MIDLHLHLDGSLEPEDILHLARLSGTDLPVSSPDALRPLLTVENTCRSLAQYLRRFSLPLTVLQTEACICEAVYRLVCRLHRQGLLYAEIRFAPQLHTGRGLTQTAVIAAAADGLARATRNTGMPAQLILCCMRNGTEAENRETLRVANQFSGAGVCAVDLAGDEAAYATEKFSTLFAAAARDIPVTIHAGEAAGAESVRCALEMGAARIGHGIRAVEDPSVLERLSQQKTVLENCYTSNLQTAAIKGDQPYPLPTFLKWGIPATLATDNTTVSGTDLKTEYRLAQSACGLSAAQLLQIAKNAAAGAFLSDEQKKALTAAVEQQFTNWIFTE